MNKQGNTYTFIYSIVLVVVVAAILAIVSLSLKPYQDENIENEKRQNILSSVNVSSTPENSAELFNKIITKQFILNYKGEAIEGNAFAVDIPTEGKKLQKAMKNPELQKALKDGKLLSETIKDDKALADIKFPVFVADIDGATKYILPTYGVGLWGPVWGYISLNEDKNTVYGVLFDHKGETPGLGAEITQPFFQKQFSGKTVFENSSLKAITVKKGGNATGAHEVDAISGGTITSKAVETMIADYLKCYEQFLKQIQ